MTTQTFFFKCFNLFFFSLETSNCTSLSQRSLQVVSPQYSYILLLVVLRFGLIFRFLTALDLFSWVYEPNHAQTILSVFFAPALGIYINLITAGRSFPSAEPVFFNFWWLERETFEMSGVFFFNKLDSRNLLLEYFNPTTPLVKSSPVFGFSEIFFSYTNNLLVLIPISVQT